MKKMNDTKTTVFATDHDGFRIDIVEHKTGETQWDVWLYHEGIGIKQYVIGEMRMYNHSIDDVVKGMEEYLTNTMSFGLNWYEQYEEDYMEKKFDDIFDFIMDYTNPYEDMTIEDAGEILSDAEANGYVFPEWVTPQAFLEVYHDCEPEDEDDDEEE